MEVLSQSLSQTFANSLRTCMQPLGTMQTALSGQMSECIAQIGQLN